MTATELMRRSVRRGLMDVPPGTRRRFEPALLRGYELYRQMAERGTEQQAWDGGLPVPPARLRVQAAAPEVNAFLDSGRRQAGFISELLTRNGAPLGPRSALLDFGCGCGRVVRWFGGPDGPTVHGCDPNRATLAWTRQNLPFVNAALSETDPPLPYVDGSFDAVYALSVFTHLPGPEARAWMAELHRVLKVGGVLVLTTLGDFYRRSMTPEQAAAFDRGDEVVQFGSAPGSNLCSVYHPRPFVEGRLLTDYRLLEAVHPTQDIELAERTGQQQDTWVARALPAGR